MMITLVDGRSVASDSIEWRDECLARHVARKPWAARKEWLDKFKAIHGAGAAQHLIGNMERVRAAR